MEFFRHKLIVFINFPMFNFLNPTKSHKGRRSDGNQFNMLKQDWKQITSHTCELNI